MHKGHHHHQIPAMAVGSMDEALSIEVLGFLGECTHFCQPKLVAASALTRTVTGRQHAVIVGLRMLLGQLPADHRHAACLEQSRESAQIGSDQSGGLRTVIA